MPSLETHPLKPFLPNNAKVLLLGSFPPQQKRWSINFFYPNFQNDMWRIMGMLFFADKDIFVDHKNKCFHQKAIETFAAEAGIAFYDTAEIIQRLKDNASDNFLRIVQPTNLEKLISQLPQCYTIATTGEKATNEVLTQYNAQKPKIGETTTLQIGARQITLYRMPSTSRAYPLSITQKATFYHNMFQDLRLL